MEINAISIIDLEIIIIDGEVSLHRVYCGSRKQLGNYLRVVCVLRRYRFINIGYSLSTEYLSDQYD